MTEPRSESVDPAAIRRIDPGSIAPPAAKYAHAVQVGPGARTLFTSGVVGVLPDGTVPTDLTGQTEAIWANLAAILGEAEMEVSDLVSITTYVVAGQDLSVVMAVRDRLWGDHRAASTLVIVPALARPEWLVEISAIAAR